MKDTTTTIDEILGQLLGKVSVEFMSHPDGKRIVMPAKELYNFQQEAKQALLQWHRDKARSYVLEVIGDNEVYIDIPEVDNTGKVTKVHRGESYTPYMLARNTLRAEQRVKLDQTLKAIGGQDNE